MVFHLDLRPLTPEYREVAILQHPQIPGPLSGVNPRTILGESWWRAERQAAYARNHYHCQACAGAADDDPYVQVLHAHECYDIEWEKATATYERTVALCWCCHNFIHSGRMAAMTVEGKTSRAKLEHVLRRGIKILDKEGLLPYWRTYSLAREFLHGDSPYEAIQEVRKVYEAIPISDLVRLPEGRWTLVIYENKYRRQPNGRIAQV